MQAELNVEEVVKERSMKVSEASFSDSSVIQLLTSIVMSDIVLVRYQVFFDTDRYLNFFLYSILTL